MDRLTAYPTSRLCYFWECPNCHVEHEVLYGECDREYTCAKCGRPVYVCSASVADRTDVGDV